MKKTIQQVLVEQRAKVATALALASVHGMSLAGTLGGIQAAQSAGDDLKTGLFALVGSLAGLYLLYLAVMAWTEKKSWSDFGFGIIYVGVAGGALTLASWAWTMYTS